MSESRMDDGILLWSVYHAIMHLSIINFLNPLAKRFKICYTYTNQIIYRKETHYGKNYIYGCRLDRFCKERPR